MSTSQDKSNIDSIWASMNEDVPNHTVDLKSLNQKETKKKSIAKKINSNNNNGSTSSTKSLNRKPQETKDKRAVQRSLEEMKRCIASDVQRLNSADGISRKSSLQNIYDILFVDGVLKEEDYSSLFHDLCKPIFKCFSDSNEKCRELSQRLTTEFIKKSCDLLPVLAYYFPALLQRIPRSIFFDQELQIFVHDIESHEAYKRGKAVDRQDRSNITEPAIIKIVESAEEIRLLTCNTLIVLIHRVKELGAIPILHPYFEEIIMFLQAQLRDIFSELKIAACNGLEELAGTSEFELGMKYYSVALVRGILPVLRHKHAKVRLSAVKALHKCFVVPDRAKRKAAGSDAIPDLVGFREENVLPVSAFYKPDVQINYLAELVSDQSALVREQLAIMLTSLLTEIGDRYDHQTRLLPYILDLIVDEVDSVSGLAYHCLQICGKQYEEEHFEEILEKKQYGVDGDARINLSKPLPMPFPERPSIGIRLYARGNTKRFLNALLGELTNWMAPTRLKSSRLLKIIVILCEEHLTMEINTLLPVLLKALKFAREDKDLALLSNLIEVGEFLGRYILPEIYIFYLLPRLKGESDVCPGGIDNDTRLTIMILLEALLSGSKATQLIPHIQAIFDVITDRFYLDYESIQLQTQVLQVASSIFNVVLSQKGNMMEAFYLSTGRLDVFHVTVRKILKHCFISSQHKSLIGPCISIIYKLVDCCNYADLSTLFSIHSYILAKECMDAYELVEAAENISVSSSILLNLLECPYAVLYSKSEQFVVILKFLLTKAVELRSLNLDFKAERSAALKLLEMLNCLLSPVISSRLNWRLENEEFNQKLYQSQFPIYQSHLTKSSELVTIVSDSLEAILNLFLFEDRWNASQQLIFQRLYLLSTLFGVRFPEVDMAYESGGDEGWQYWKLLVKDHRNEEDGLKENVVRINAPHLANHADRIFSNFFTTVVSPTSTLSARLCGIHVLGGLLDTIRKGFQLDRVRSFEFSLNYDWSESKFGSISNYVQIKQKMQAGLLRLLTTFSDGDHEVREKAISIFSQNLHFILSDTEQTHPIEEIRDISYSKLLKLMVQILINLSSKKVLAETEEEIELIDYVVRSLCILDPSNFVKILTAECREHLRSSSTENEITLANRLNDLLSHAELILTLQGQT